MDDNGTTDATSPHSSDTVNGGLGDGAQAVKVAVHIRPLIGTEVFQGCKDCVAVVPGEPQVHIGSHSFTFDHVYGSTASPSSKIFEECVSPLVDGLFQGYNATVLAYGQTGSGKTYTMGTAYTVGGSTEGIIPKVMELIFNKVTAFKEKAEFQIRVSFIEILKEEVHDLLDPNPPIAIKLDASNSFGSKAVAPGKVIQIRENTSGEITLAGVTEIGVCSLEEMAACLEQGSLCRATASTNMNSRSSRSHAIFTITVEQRRLLDSSANGTNNTTCDDMSDDFLCAKLHLVDLAGSERAKRTGADGLRFKEGVHINKGLLALGNVISALGDDKKRKEGGHVPYRDSKLTRLLQDSLGGNSRTVMLACISPADSNAEETLNTLKYANRARNIQNKPVVNRDPMAAEMQRMRQQVDLLQAELLCIKVGGSFEEVQILKQRIAWLETSLLEMQQELRVARDNLHHARDNLHQRTQRLVETEAERDKLQLKIEMFRDGKTWDDVMSDGVELQSAALLESYAQRIKLLEDEVQNLRDITPQASSFGQQNRTGSGLDIDPLSLSLTEGAEATQLEEETVAKEMEHARLQDSLDKELEELNKRLEQKEAEMKTFSKCDGVVLKQHFEKKILELEEEKKVLQSERDKLLAELTRLANSSDNQSNKLQETYLLKVKTLENQILELKKKQENQAQLLKQKQRSDEAAKRLQDEIQRIKSHKVQLQQKIKQESEQFRLWKALREKEVLQLKKEGRRNEYEMHKLQALNQRQKMVLQRKTEEAAVAMRRLKELLGKTAAKENSTQGATSNGVGIQNEKTVQNWLDHELEVKVRIHEVSSNQEKQRTTQAALAEELSSLKREQDVLATENNSFRLQTAAIMSPGARQAKIVLLESMLNACSHTSVALASQLSEAKDREMACGGRARWQHVRSMGDAKNLLQVVFDAAVDARCMSSDKDIENRELKERIVEVEALLNQSEFHRQERERKQIAKEQYIAKMVTSAMKVGTISAMKSCLEEVSKHLIKPEDAGPRQLQYPEGCSEASANENSNYGVRKSSKGTTSAQNVDFSSTANSSEGEDMDTDDIDIDDDGSDEDWTELDERPSFKGKMKKVKAEKSPVGPTEQDTVPLESGGQCCSCKKTSGCKTSKCSCKASGSFCGSNCACSVKKCANRGAGSEKGEAAEVVQAIETLELDKEIKFVQRNQAKECDQSVAENLIMKGDVQRAEHVLAKHGAAMLDTVWTDELQAAIGAVARSSQPAHENPLAEKGSARKPLSDIGNNAQPEDADGKQKMKPRKRWGKTLVQLVPTTTEPRHSTAINHRDMHPAENTVEVTTNLDTTNVAAPPHQLNNDNATRSLPPISESEGLRQLYGVPLQRDGIVPAKMHRNAKRATLLSPPSSPLRARNNHAAAEESGALSKRLANTGSSASPRAPGKGIVNEKENV